MKPLPGRRHVFHEQEGVSAERYAGWLGVASAAAIPPVVPNRFVVRPQFQCGDQSYFGGYAFVVSFDSGDAFVLTALHVMDEAIKASGLDCSPTNQSYTGEELPRRVTNVIAYDVFAPKWMLAKLAFAGPMLVLPGSRVGDEEPYSERDIAAFRASREHFSPATLAAHLPDAGEPIWLAVNGGEGMRERTMEAVVVERTERTLIFRFSSDAIPRFTSGAPLLNRDGAVVGINVGGGAFAGKRFGHANHVVSIRRHLETAARKTTTPVGPGSFG